MKPATLRHRRRQDRLPLFLSHSAPGPLCAADSQRGRPDRPSPPAGPARQAAGPTRRRVHRAGRPLGGGPSARYLPGGPDNPRQGRLPLLRRHHSPVRPGPHPTRPSPARWRPVPRGSRHPGRHPPRPGRRRDHDCRRAHNSVRLATRAVLRTLPGRAGPGRTRPTGSPPGARGAAVRKRGQMHADLGALGSCAEAAAGAVAGRCGYPRSAPCRPRRHRWPRWRGRAGYRTDGARHAGIIWSAGPRAGPRLERPSPLVLLLCVTLPEAPGLCRFLPLMRHCRQGEERSSGSTAARLYDKLNTWLRSRPLRRTRQP